MKFDLSDMTVLRFGATNKSILKQMLQPKAISSPTVIHTCFIDNRCKILHQFSAEKNSYLGFEVFELASLMCP